MSRHEYRLLPAKVPVESVQPGFSLAIRRAGGFRLFQVECTQMSQRSGEPVMFTLTSESGDGGRPWSWSTKRVRRWFGYSVFAR